MDKGGKFSVYEGVLFTTIIIVSKILYTNVSVIIKQMGTSAWYSTIISCGITIICYLIICILMNRFPGKNLIEVYEIVLGKVIGKILCLLFSGYTLYYAVSNVREFIEMIKVYNLPDTPPSIILLTFIAVIVIASYKGIETIVRVGCINFYPIIFGLLIILILAFPYYDFDYLKPYLGYGLKKTLLFAVNRSSAYEEILIIPVVFVSTYSIKDLKKIGVISISLSGFFFTISLACYTAAFQYTLGKENLSGMFELTRIIYFNRYFQRIEPVFLFAWVISAVLTVCVGFYGSLRVYCQVFEIADHRPILLPFAILMYVSAFIPKNISEVIEINIRFIRSYSYAPVYGAPILILIIAIILRKKG